MQTTLRGAGNVMNASDHKKHVQIHEEGKLIKPEQSGHLIAALTMRAAQSLHGQFFNWDADEFVEYQK